MDSDQIAAMTPAEATAALAAMSTAAAASPPPAQTSATSLVPPATAADARAHLDRLVADPAWGKAMLDGNADARRQFAELTAAVAAGDEIGDALAGTAAPPAILETTIGGELPRRDVETLVAGWRADGLSDGAIEEALRGSPNTRANYEAAKHLQRTKHGDAEWVAKLLSGDYAATREHKLMSIVLSAPVKD